MTAQIRPDELIRILRAEFITRPGGVPGGREFYYTFSMNGVLAITTGALRLYNRTGNTLTIAEVFAAVNTAPTGANIILDINENGTSIWNATPANRVNIVAGANTGVQTTFDDNIWAAGNYLSFDVDQIGAVIFGSDLTVMVKAL